MTMMMTEGQYEVSFNDEGSCYTEGAFWKTLLVESPNALQEFVY